MIDADDADDVTVEVDGDSEGSEPTVETKPSKGKGKKGKREQRSSSAKPLPPKPPVVEKPREERPRPQMRQPTPAQEQATAKMPGKRQRFRVEQDHRMIGPRGVMKLAAGSLVTEATHDLVQLAEEGAILVKV